MLRRIVREGDLVVRDWRGRERRYGDGCGDRVAIHIRDRATAWRLLLNPEMALGEAYMNGGLVVTQGDIRDLLDLLIRNLGPGRVPDHWLQHLLAGARHMLRTITSWNPMPRARRNVAHHYDLSDELYELFLDADKQYSCAYFEREGDSLERAQEQKKRHIAAKLLIEPGMRVLDIGCGWGGMALYLARRCGARVVGITLSEHQAAIARRRAAEAGLEGQIEIRLEDYRTVDGEFDRIVSVGMFEHVGLKDYGRFFHALRDRLSDRGIALVHSIIRMTGPAATNPWIAKYIFPGGYIPASSEVLPAVERSGLLLTDLEVWRLHYAETLKHWRSRFRAAWERAAALYDERFCRMWDFYLASSETAFRRGGMAVGQYQLALSPDAVPLRRDYIADFKNAHPVEAN
ncbi:MAG: class I SAM-dependent methyltransferase [Alphaproteobacteria bacterium]|nr:MAG: class I SAM-dependent methyltransferase [Alphaproteobacteria bacterium]